MGSHTFASVAGWDYPMTRAEMIAMASYAHAVNSVREQGSTPFVPPWPWPEEQSTETITPEDRALHEAQLRKYSAFGQLRTK
ncbi:hypothetical protein IRJ34_07315 [Paenarthrobacter sp. GOM3]|uniref:hypothetical protein n=1 Tax=Paenarthrobacter sp. GOM3 TaxID=2782567 RepID=UPI001BA5625B|nr:hypothetical protein [Paenarthrobacter sp. GOM3]WOH20125.1 hypothetical protein IRJ34_07315 [Paenarthrobacter sp. GOM3]